MSYECDLSSHYLLHETLETFETIYYIEERFYEPKYEMKFLILETSNKDEAIKEFLMYVMENKSKDAILLYKQNDGSSVCILDLDDLKNNN